MTASPSLPKLPEPHAHITSKLGDMLLFTSTVARKRDAVYLDAETLNFGQQCYEAGVRAGIAPDEDGDALRLAARAGISLHLGGGVAKAVGPFIAGPADRQPTASEYFGKTSEDASAAVRRAITRVAAEIESIRKGE